MKTKLLILLLVGATAGFIAYFPALNARGNAIDVEPGNGIAAQLTAEAPVIDVVFVLDTTGSMSGLIQTAKEKIWSIASTMAGADPAPLIRIGLVAYRDRGDDYVVRRVGLSQDLDQVYAELMQFSAGGGGDGPESVNAALHAAVTEMDWTEGGQAYRAVFLVGDAPPHMDYQDEQQYPEILAMARQRGIVVNAIQCGNQSATIAPWQQIARLGSGRYFQVEQGGGAVAYATPFDAEIAELSASLDRTRVYYGSAAEREAVRKKIELADATLSAASPEAKARRGVFGLSSAGKSSRLGDRELVEAVASGEVELDALEPELLPEELKPMAPEAQRAYVENLAGERAAIENRMQVLADQRDAYIRERLDEDGGADDSLDQKLYEAISRQAAVAGLEYEDGPSY
ncbi:MAG: VWA domain-containing protein [Woeseiaceae bacterium]|nr:VWA domain-containing protein [Woeseiaceae bacterium]